MATPTVKFELETPLEERVVRLETIVEHIQTDVSDMKIEMRRLNDKIDGVKDSVAALAIAMEKSFANVEKRFTDVERSFANVEKRFTDIEKSFAVLHSARAFDRVWWFLMLAALLGVMARGFKWI